MLLAPNGQPMPPTQAEREAQQAHAAELMTRVRACFPPPTHTSDLLLAGINLMTAYVFTGQPEAIPQRLQIAMSNLEAALGQAASIEELNAKVRAGLAAANEQHQPS